MDLNTSAFRIVQQTTSENEDGKRTLAARSGGKVGGPARATKISSVRRKEIAVIASRARWDRKETEKL